MIYIAGSFGPCRLRHTLAELSAPRCTGSYHSEIAFARGTSHRSASAPHHRGPFGHKADKAVCMGSILCPSDSRLEIERSCQIATSSVSFNHLCLDEYSPNVLLVDGPARL